MVKDIKELKDFVLWCKKEKVSELTINGINIIFAASALVDKTKPKKMTVEELELELEKQLQAENDTLFYSSGT